MIAERQKAHLEVANQLGQLSVVLLLSKQERDVPEVASNGAHILATEHASDGVAEYVSHDCANMILMTAR